MKHEHGPGKRWEGTGYTCTECRPATFPTFPRWWFPVPIVVTVSAGTMDTDSATFRFEAVNLIDHVAVAE